MMANNSLEAYSNRMELFARSKAFLFGLLNAAAIDQYDEWWGDDDVKN